ncbi:metallophosphoesterase family protein [Halorubrum sp. RMP-47]|uniref:Phosphoesterase n=1 Tax=Halorubrum miltondacostae TaxID=3076378 RepID=A0ABD5M1J3_9EURY
MDIAILSDTQVPQQREALPDPFRQRVAAADHVVHAGDFGSVAALDAIESAATELTAVYGNADPAAVDLPPVASLSAGGVTLVVSHGMVNFVERAVGSTEGVVFGPSDWFDAVVDIAQARADGESAVVGVAGHTHEVVDETHDGVRVLNPGTATGVGGDEAPSTMLTAEVADGAIDVTTHTL